MLNFLLVIDVLIAIGLIALILLQRGPGATAGAAFGSGASGTVFGARGSANFLTRATAVLAAGFFIVTIAMAMVASRQVGNQRNDDLGVMAAPPATTTEVEVPIMNEESSDAGEMAREASTMDSPAIEAAGDDVPELEMQPAADDEASAMEADADN